MPNISTNRSSYPCGRFSAAITKYIGRRPVPYYNHRQVNAAQQPVNPKVLLGKPQNGTLLHQKPKGIALLRPYMPSHVIKGKVANKSECRVYCNENGEGCYFSFELIDKTGSIKILTFDKRCKALFPKIEDGNCLMILGLTVKQPKAEYFFADKEGFINFGAIVELIPPSSVPSSPFVSANLTHSQQLPPATPAPSPALANDMNSLRNVTGFLHDVSQCNCKPVVSYCFQTLWEATKLSVGDSFHLCAVIKAVGEPLDGSKGNQHKSRKLKLVDNTMVECLLQLWGEQAVNFRGQVGEILLVKNVTICKDNTLSTTNNSVVLLHPNLPVAQQLRMWWCLPGKDRQDFIPLNGCAPGSRSHSQQFSRIIQ